MSTVLTCEDIVTATRKRLYLDVCTYCRPYDEQSLLPIRLETDAYYLILNHVERGRYTLVVSPVHFAEVADISEVRQRVEVQQLLALFRSGLKYSAAEVRARAEELVRRKFGVADAAHVAFAEATADVFVTCDRVLIKRCRAHAVRLKVYNPVEFVAREGIS